MSDSLSGIPRSEYPRPDFQRGTSQGIDWINLNGTWEFVFDPDDIVCLFDISLPFFSFVWRPRGPRGI